VSGFRRFIPYLAALSVLAAVAVTATLASVASAAPPNDTVAAAANRPVSSQSALAAQSAQASASRASAAALASASAAAASASASASASAKAAAAASAAAKAAAAPRDTAGLETAALRAAGVPCDIHAVACVSLSKQEAWLLRDGKVVYGPVHVATGRAGLPTPTGNFHVWYKVVNGWSTTYDAPMPYSVFFYKGDAFHEDPVTVRSHGCVHLSLQNAEYFYHFLHYGDLVEVRR